MDHKAPDAFRSISEVADELDLPQHVLRFWESRFRDIKPMKRGGGRRYYRPDDVNLLRGIRHLLYGEGYTIRGVQRILREQGAKFVAAVWQEGAPQPPHGATRRRGCCRRSRIGGGRGRRRGARPGQPADVADRPRSERPRGRRRGAPRAAAQERAGAAHRADRSRDPWRADVLPPAMQPAPAVPAVQVAAPTARLAREDLRKLHAVLHELAECRKLIETAVAPVRIGSAGLGAHLKIELNTRGAVIGPV